MTTESIVAGVLGGRWRATVTTWGGLEPWDGSAELDWHIAADDRWHSPREESTVRQASIDGTPVVETRVRIPNGDAVQRIYSIADGGGMTVIEVENDSPLPIAVAFTRPDLLSVRPPTDMAIHGIDLPSQSIVFPVGHHSILAVAIAHDGRGSGALPTDRPPALQAARGWLALCERASRLVLPDVSIAEQLTSARCELILLGPDDPSDDPVGFLIGVGELIRTGEQAAHWVPDVAEAVHRAARAERSWDLDAAWTSAERVLLAAGERKAVKDLRRVVARRREDATASSAVPPIDTIDSAARRVAAIERRFADAGALLPEGLPVDWLGQNVEVYGIPTGPTSSVSFALRWHGSRPAVLWECTGDPTTLTAPVIAPDWSTSEDKGEALWPEPPGSATAATFAPAPDMPSADAPPTIAPPVDRPSMDGPTTTDPGTSFS